MNAEEFMMDVRSQQEMANDVYVIRVEQLEKMIKRYVDDK